MRRPKQWLVILPLLAVMGVVYAQGEREDAQAELTRAKDTVSAGIPAQELVTWQCGLAIFKTMKGTERNQALCCQKIGVALVAMGRYDEGIEYHWQALTLFAALEGMEAEKRKCWGHIGDAESGANRYSEAIAAYAKAGTEWWISRATALAYASRGEPGDREKAAEYLLKALRDATKTLPPEAAIDRLKAMSEGSAQLFADTVAMVRLKEVNPTTPSPVPPAAAEEETSAIVAEPVAPVVPLPPAPENEATVEPVPPALAPGMVPPVPAPSSVAAAESVVLALVTATSAPVLPSAEPAAPAVSALVPGMFPPALSIPETVPPAAPVPAPTAQDEAPTPVVGAEPAVPAPAESPPVPPAAAKEEAPAAVAESVAPVVPLPPAPENETTVEPAPPALAPGMVPPVPAPSSVAATESVVLAPVTATSAPVLPSAVPASPASWLAGPTEGQNWTVPELGMEVVWIPVLKCWAGRYETTNGEYRRFKPDHDSQNYRRTTLNDNRQPVVFVGLEDANAFANWLTARERTAGRLPEDLRYRLPTREEWTTFAECGDARVYPWGNDWPPPSGNYADQAAQQSFSDKAVIDGYDDGFAVTCPVEKSGCNHWGLFGLGGNVWECTAGSAENGFAEWRGASWAYDINAGLRCGFRYITGAANRANDCGFRLVLSR